MTLPRLSIVVVVHKMVREAPRTLHGLSCSYQTAVGEDQYEVIVVENGVQELAPNLVAGFGKNFRYHFHASDSVSPAAAVNVGFRMARGEFVAIIVDGARIPTPGLVAQTLRSIAALHSCFVGALAWQLGPDVQWKAIMKGYNKNVEDGLLDGIEWPEHGYRLFEIATIAPSSACGFLNGLPGEFSWLALPATTFRQLGGYDERFQTPGGGLVNQDFLRRLCALQGLIPVVLLGEGTFHQVHGGAITSKTAEQRPMIMDAFKAEYAQLRGREFVPLTRNDCVYFGSMPEQAKRFIGSAKD